jgi:hypothetical protein
MTSSPQIEKSMRVSLPVQLWLASAGFWEFTSLLRDLSEISTP